MHTDSLLQLLSSYVPITGSDQSLINEAFVPLTCKKNEVLCAYGASARYMYFINSGFMRVFHYENGMEITNHLGSENNFITSYNSFISGVRSEEVVQAISSCELLGITKDALHRLYRLSHPMALFGIYMSDRYLLFNNQRSKDLITLNAEERYIKLMREEPGIIKHVPLQFIASYIGIEPQTLSRIRRKIIS